MAHWQNFNKARVCCHTYGSVKLRTGTAGPNAKCHSLDAYDTRGVINILLFALFSTLVFSAVLLTSDKMQQNLSD